MEKAASRCCVGPGIKLSGTKDRREVFGSASPVPERHTWDKRSHRSYHLIDNITSLNYI